jgi:hypothetical protein
MRFIAIVFDRGRTRRLRRRTLRLAVGTSGSTTSRATLARTSSRQPRGELDCDKTSSMTRANTPSPKASTTSASVTVSRSVSTARRASASSSIPAGAASRSRAITSVNAGDVASTTGHARARKEPVPLSSRSCTITGRVGDVSTTAQVRRRARNRVSIPSATTHEPLLDDSAASMDG